MGMMLIIIILLYDYYAIISDMFMISLILIKISIILISFIQFYILLYLLLKLRHYIDYVKFKSNLNNFVYYINKID